MKTVNVGQRERSDINAQVEKVLRDLGNPEPPLRLELVRELLRLDLQYYSTTNDSVLREFASKVKKGAMQLFLRPTLLFDIVKKADLTALWLPDPRRILLDESVPKLKHRWNETHEIIHSMTEWHKAFLFGDSAKELSPACHDQLEAEANYGAGQLLFLREKFAVEARQLGMSMASVKAMHTRFGNTLTSTLWRYVEQLGSTLPMLGLVTVHPRRVPDDHDVTAPCKYFIESPAFRQQFETVSEVEVFNILGTYCKTAKGGPLGSDEVILKDVNGTAHVFHFETFCNTHQALTLAYYVRKHTLIVPVCGLAVA